MQEGIPGKDALVCAEKRRDSLLSLYWKSKRKPLKILGALKIHERAKFRKGCVS
jgi:hypothetical protein